MEPEVLTAEPQPPPEREPFWGYADLLMFVGLTIPCMLISLGAVRGVMWIFGLHPTQKTWELLPEQALLYAMLTAALAAIFRLQYDRPFWRSLAWIPFRLPPLWPVILGFSTAIVVSLVGVLIRVPTAENPMTQLLKDRTSMVMIALFGVSVGPLCEELFFRGFLQPLLVRSLGVAAGIAASAVPFSLLHFQQYGNSWRHVAVILIAGVAFGWMRHATGSTRASTLMHASYNGLFFFALFRK